MIGEFPLVSIKYENILSRAGINELRNQEQLAVNKIYYAINKMLVFV